MKFKTLAVMVVLLACASIGKADIVNWYCWDDGDGVITCADVDWGESGGEYEMTITGTHNLWDKGHMVGWFDTAEDDGDPTIKVNNIIDNDIFGEPDWIDYHINVYMTLPFTLSDAIVNDPTDWTATSGSVSATWNGSQYVAGIDYYAGTAIEYGDTLDFGYKLVFVGSPGQHYTYTQEMYPTPEPGTFVLLACGLVGLLFIRRRFA